MTSDYFTPDQVSDAQAIPNTTALAFTITLEDGTLGRATIAWGPIHEAPDGRVLLCERLNMLADERGPSEVERLLKTPAGLNID